MRETMPLSAAIRLGSMLKPQGFGPGAMCSPDSSCALGAAADCLGLNVSMFQKYQQLYETFPVLNETRLCELCDAAGNLGLILWHLNDQHCWTREAIADFVESIEAQQPTAPPVEVACE